MFQAKETGRERPRRGVLLHGARGVGAAAAAHAVPPRHVPPAARGPRLPAPARRFLQVHTSTLHHCDMLHGHTMIPCNSNQWIRSRQGLLSTMHNGSARPISIPVSHTWSSSHSPVCLYCFWYFDFHTRFEAVLIEVQYYRSTWDYRAWPARPAARAGGRAPTTRSAERCMVWTSATSGARSASGKRRVRVSMNNARAIRTHTRALSHHQWHLRSLLFSNC